VANRGVAKGRMDRWQDGLPAPVRRVVVGLQGDDILVLASSLSFYALVSIIPLVILVLWLAGLLVGHGEIQSFADSLAKQAPKNLGIDKVARQIANLGRSIGLVAVIGMLWPSTAYGAGLVRAFDRLRQGQGRRLKGLRGRLLALSFVVCLPVLVLGALFISYAMTQVFGAGVGYLGALVVTFVAACVTVGLIYRVFPPDRLSWSAIWAGTVGTAVAIAVLSVGYTVFLNVGADFETHYASSGVAAVVLLAVWLYLANAVLLAGYQSAIEFERTSSTPSHAERREGDVVERG
jgi:membrane protein